MKHTPHAFTNWTDESFQCDICEQPIQPGQDYIEIFNVAFCLFCLKTLGADQLEEIAKHEATTRQTHHSTELQQADSGHRSDAGRGQEDGHCRSTTEGTIMNTTIEEYWLPPEKREMIRGVDLLIQYANQNVLNLEECYNRAVGDVEASQQTINTYRWAMIDARTQLNRLQELKAKIVDMISVMGEEYLR